MTDVGNLGFRFEMLSCQPPAPTDASARTQSQHRSDADVRGKAVDLSVGRSLTSPTLRSRKQKTSRVPVENVRLQSA
jgi:hypothetical protein